VPITRGEVASLTTAVPLAFFSEKVSFLAISLMVVMRRPPGSVLVRTSLVDTLKAQPSIVPTKR
jgi:hypothetical protein